MTKTREQLIDRALLELGVVAAGQVANAEDSAVIEAAIDPVMAELSSRGVYNYGDPDSFEDDAFDMLAVCLANARAVAFGKAEDESARTRAETRLRLLNGVYRSGQPLKAEYF